jgi:glycosyltransferase involved in cell wall biosynthesis
MSTPEVAVVTPTRNRPHLLWRAVESAAAQQDVRIRHVIVGDDCPALADPAFVARLTGAFPHVTVINTTPQSHPRVQHDYRWARVARLRNLGSAATDLEFIAHLDDDNTWDPGHLSSLVAGLRANPAAELAHGWRRLLYDDGSPFFIPEGLDPWNDDPESSAKSYTLLVASGVVTPGSNILRDRMSFNGILLGRVDNNELMVRRRLFERIPYPEEFSRWKQKLGLGDDALLNYLLLKDKVEIMCTEQVTVNYFMGGKSNQETLAPLMSAAS